MPRLKFGLWPLVSVRELGFVKFTKNKSEQNNIRRDIEIDIITKRVKIWQVLFQLTRVSTWTFSFEITVNPIQFLPCLVSRRLMALLLNFLFLKKEETGTPKTQRELPFVQSINNTNVGIHYWRIVFYFVGRWKTLVLKPLIKIMNMLSEKKSYSPEGRGNRSNDNKVGNRGNEN